MHFHVTVIAGAQKTEQDVKSGGDSEDDAEEIASAEKVQADAIKEFKLKRKSVKCKMNCGSNTVSVVFFCKVLLTFPPNVIVVIV